MPICSPSSKQRDLHRSASLMTRPSDQGCMIRWKHGSDDASCRDNADRLRRFER